MFCACSGVRLRACLCSGVGVCAWWFVLVVRLRFRGRLSFYCVHKNSTVETLWKSQFYCGNTVYTEKLYCGTTVEIHRSTVEIFFVLWKSKFYCGNLVCTVKTSRNAKQNSAKVITTRNKSTRGRETTEHSVYTVEN